MKISLRSSLHMELKSNRRHALKRTKLLLMVLSPVFVGFLLNQILLSNPSIIYAAPFLMIGYWFWVGRKFAAYVRNPFGAILLANAMGIVSLAVYYWQFILTSGQARNTILAGLSQMFSAPLSMITARIGLVFEKAPDEITQVTAFVMQAAGLTLMITIFCIGYFTKKRQARKHAG
jgi:hypothetical protein